ncbi:MAG: 2-nitropropane dioxygenase, partial [Rivularia sp. (in: cyanobacteria)]
MQTLDNVLNKENNGLTFHGSTSIKNRVWKGSISCISFDPEGIKEQLLEIDKPCYIVKVGDRIGVTNYGYCPLDNSQPAEIELLIAAPPTFTKNCGDSNFIHDHNLKYAYTTGAMAGGIASEEMVIALGKENILSSFGAGGLSLTRLEEAIKIIQASLPHGPYAFNLIHSPGDPEIERGA